MFRLVVWLVVAALWRCAWRAGRGHVAAIAKPGVGPFGVTVNDRTHTVYVVNNAAGDAPGTVSVINGATCNGTHTAGCRQHFPTFATGRAPLNITVDERTDALYITGSASADVTAMDGSRCNASVTTGCGAPREQPVGSLPVSVAVNPRSGTVYVARSRRAPCQFSLPDADRRLPLLRMVKSTRSTSMAAAMPDAALRKPSRNWCVRPVTTRKECR
jgi:hypothetical protein